MAATTTLEMTRQPTPAQPDESISAVIRQEQARLKNFIRSRVPDPLDAEDILQDVFYELISAYEWMEPLEHAGAWLFRVARNRIIDRFRAGKPNISLDSPISFEDDQPSVLLAEILPSSGAGPEAAYARTVLLHELEDAIDELPPDQREVFLAHEVEGRTFKEISAATGVGVNTLLSRKHYAVLHLRQRLRTIYEELEKD